MPYYPLTQAKNPDNAMLDFSGLNQAVQNFGQTTRANAMAEYQAGRNKVADGRAAAGESRAAERWSMEKDEYKTAQKDAAMKKIVGIAQLIDQEQDPARKAQMWSGVRSSVKDFDADLSGMGVDPNDAINGPKFLIAQQAGYRDPMAARKAEAEIANTQAQTGYYNAQSQAKDVGAGVKEVGGRLVRMNPDGTVTEVYKPPAGGSDPNVVRNLGAGLDRLAAVPGDMGKYSFEAATGPLQGSDGYVLAPLARAWGSVINMAGSHSTTEVRNRINGDSLALAAAIKPLVRKPGEGTWTDKDQELLNSIVGNLSQANNQTEYFRGLEAVRERIKANFGIDLPAINIPNGQPRQQGQAPQLAPGTVEDGYRYKGGDPADRNSWEPAS
jgi:hypothetical protein